MVLITLQSANFIVNKFFIAHDLIDDMSHASSQSTYSEKSIL